MDWLAYLVMGLGLTALYALITANLRGIRVNSRRTSRDPRQGRDFTPTQSLHASDGATGLAFDRHRKKLRLLYSLGGAPVFRTLDYRDLLACEIVEDGRTVAKTERTSAINKPSLGRLPTTGRQTIAEPGQERVGRLELRLVLNDPARPQHTVNLLDYPTRRGGAAHGQADTEAQHWYRLLKVLIHQADLTEVPDAPMRPVADAGD